MSGRRKIYTMTDSMDSKNLGQVELLSGLIDLLYSGLLDPSPWEAFLRALADHLGSAFATIIFAVPGATQSGLALSPNASPQGTENYMTTFFASDPFSGLPEGKVVKFTEFVASEQQEVFNREYLDNAGGDQIIGVDLRAASGFEARIRVTRDQSRPDFGRSECEVLQRLVPHVRNAVRLYERLATIGTEQGVFQAAVEEMAVASIILDKKRRILRTNARAELLLAQSDGLKCNGAQLLLGNRDQQQALDALFRALNSGGDPASIGPLRLRIERPSGARDLAIVAQPIAGPAFMRGATAAAIALFISEPGAGASASPEAIRDLLQLTHAEAQLAAVLADGISLVDAAQRLGIAHNTARAQLRAIFSKTGVRRQSQLVYLISTGLPWRSV